MVLFQSISRPTRWGLVFVVATALIVGGGAPEAPPNTPRPQPTRRQPTQPQVGEGTPTSVQATAVPTPSGPTATPLPTSTPRPVASSRPLAPYSSTGFPVITAGLKPWYFSH